MVLNLASVISKPPCDEHAVYAADKKRLVGARKVSPLHETSEDRRCGRIVRVRKRFAGVTSGNAKEFYATNKLSRAKRGART